MAELLRTVRMTFRPDRLDEFLALFAETRGRIRSAPGCRHLELWRDERFPNVLTTFSRWDGPEALDAYRHSALFRETWARTVPLFAAAPAAHSQYAVDPGEHAA
jgi:quinol monooxygenase YgiN